MHRRVLVTAITLLTAALSILCVVTPAAFAEIKYVEHIKIMGQNITIIIPGVTLSTGVRFDFAHMDGGTHGIRDSLIVYVYSNAANRWIMTAGFSDTEEGFAYISEVYAQPSATFKLLEPNELQVRGTTNVICRWSIPLVVPAIMGFPEIVIPPGHITLNQYGDASSGTTIVPVPFPSGFRFRVDWNSYNAEGHFVCPELRCNGDIVGANINFDTTQTATHP